MADDIVTRLRELAESVIDKTDERFQWLVQAADEIERQRDELRQAWDIADRAVAVMQSLAYGLRCKVPSVEEVIDMYIKSERSVESAYDVEESELQRAEIEEFHMRQASRG